MDTRFKKIALVTIVCVLLYALTGFFLLPAITKSVMVNKLSAALKRTVVVEDIGFNPFVLSLTIRNLKIEDKDNTPFVAFDTLYVNVQLSSLLKKGPILRRLELKNPFVRISRLGSGEFNFSDLIETPPEEKEARARSSSEKDGLPSPRIPFLMRDIRIEGGTVVFSDHVTGLDHTLADIDFSLPLISSLPRYTDVDLTPRFSAKFNGSAISISGTSRWFDASRKSRMRAKISGLEVPRYVAYLPAKPRAILKSGRIDAETTWVYECREDQPAVLSAAGPVMFSRFELADENGSPVAEVPELQVMLAPSNLMASQFHLNRVHFRNPRVRIALNETAELNLIDMMPAKVLSEKPSGTDDPKRPFSFRVDRLQVSNGQVDFSDRSRKAPFRTTVAPVDILVENFSLRKEEKTSYSLSLTTESREALAVDGTFSLHPFENRGHLKLTRADLNKYAPYYRDVIRFDIPEGAAGFETDFYVRTGSGTPQISLSELSVAIDDLKLKHRDTGDVFCRIPRFSLTQAAVDTQKREVSIGTLSTENGFLLAARDSAGGINLETLVSPTNAAADESAADTDEIPVSPWIVSLQEAMIDGYTLRAEDHQVPGPMILEMDQIHFHGKGLSTRKDAKKGRAAVSLRINRQGTFAAQGRVGLAPVSADLDIELKHLDIQAAQPYLSNVIKLVIIDGDLSSSGRLTLATAPGETPYTRYQGEVFLSNLSTVDESRGKEFLKWTSFLLSEVDVEYAPLSLRIREAALSDFFCYLIIHNDGKINFGDIVADNGSVSAADTKGDSGTEHPIPSKSEAAAEKSISIDTVTLQNGTIDFTDQLIKPSLKLDLMEISGRVSGLSSMETTYADVFLKGRLQNHSPLEIKGKINPLTDDLYADVHLVFSDIDLPTFTPYSGKYIGHTLQKGKLTLDLTYKVVENKLQGTNSIFMDQLTLGEKVDSPEATSLPVGLAISLLKDRDGQIHLDVPVQGDLNDPEFSLGRTIVKVIVNLFVKMITSPFALIGNLFGGGEELSTMVFDYGRSTLDSEDTKKLNTLAQALYDRPSLKLEIEGSADVEKDREALVEKRFDELIKEEKFKDTVQQGDLAVPLEQVSIAADEYEKYLLLAYGAADFPKPRDEFGKIKDLTVSEMEKLLFTHIQMTENDLRQLAIERAKQVKDYLLGSGKVTPERIFIIEPNLQPTDAEKPRENNRVNFKLK